VAVGRDKLVGPSLARLAPPDRTRLCDTPLVLSGCGTSMVRSSARKTPGGQLRRSHPDALAQFQDAGASQGAREFAEHVEDWTSEVHRPQTTGIETPVLRKNPAEPVRTRPSDADLYHLRMAPGPAVRTWSTRRSGTGAVDP
jgi:hypothetical protein